LLQQKKKIKEVINMVKFIFLDHHATTPCDPQVINTMMPFITDNFVNPSNHLHYLGRMAHSAVENAREKVATLINARPSQVIFTSGATESNNLAILGAVRAYAGNRRKIVTLPIEHKSILEPISVTNQWGYQVVYLPLDKAGTVKLSEAVDLIDENTLLVCIQGANNEIGTIQSIIEIAKIAKEKGALVHCDAAQTVGKIPIDVNDSDIDFLSISSHKLYGPKGVGALYIKNPSLAARKLMPLSLGGGQEQNLRPGTYNVPGIVGFGEACEICLKNMVEETLKVTQLRDSFESLLKFAIPEIIINGNVANRLPGNSNITFPGIEGEALLLNVPKVVMSLGSACNTGALEPSYVLTSIGISRELASCSIRVGIGRFTTPHEVGEAVSLIVEAYDKFVSS
jgi:cysteine desulfurase